MIEHSSNWTGISPQASYSTGGPDYPIPQATPVNVSKKELIELWYMEPLKKMKGHEAFICLSMCLFLYEKYLRKSGAIGEDENFSEGHKVFKQIGKDFGISAEDSYEFWTCWRNGLAHRGMPLTSDKYKWGMTSSQNDCVCITDTTFTLNPWRIREVILNKISVKKRIWNDELAPLMKVFRQVEP
jgi:hypothetical protein